MRLIDADKLESGEVIIPTENGGYEYVEVFYKDDVDNAPSVDAVEVVRCKDCRWYEESKNSEIYPMRFCYRLKNDNGVRVGYNCDSNDFCSHGERREDETN